MLLQFGQILLLTLLYIKLIKKDDNDLVNFHHGNFVPVLHSGSFTRPKGDYVRFKMFGRLYGNLKR